MISFRRILFPVDFSERCLQTAPYVAWIARRFGSQITLLHAMDKPPDPPRFRTELPRLYEDLVKINQSELAAFAPGVFDGVAVTRIIDIGEVAEVITRYAKRNEADLIVIPTHGLGTFRWLLLGSVTAKVLNDSLCPVWTTVHSEKVHPIDGEIGSIICGVDIYSDPARVIEAASGMAAIYGGIVRLVHVIGAPEASSQGAIHAELKSFLFKTAREEVDKCQKQAGTSWEVCVQGGTVASVLRDEATRCQADLVVIGRGHLQDRFGRFRTHVGAIIRESPCSVLSV
ncbi:MAG TPA: universal stress protein [Bryobacteraceae bacterium]|jgi:nucleotide-binding universal stress UspA family protein|nr:universal stress protein [Bryobacteraceae bacterium]